MAESAQRFVEVVKREPDPVEAWREHCRESRIPCVQVKRRGDVATVSGHLWPTGRVLTVAEWERLRWLVPQVPALGAHQLQRDGVQFARVEGARAAEVAEAVYAVLAGEPFPEWVQRTVTFEG